MIIKHVRVHTGAYWFQVIDEGRMCGTLELLWSPGTGLFAVKPLATAQRDIELCIVAAMRLENWMNRDEELRRALVNALNALAHG